VSSRSPQQALGAVKSTDNSAYQAGSPKSKAGQAAVQPILIPFGCPTGQAAAVGIQVGQQLKDGRLVGVDKRDQEPFCGSAVPTGDGRWWRGAQTDLMGADIEEQKKEVARLRLMIEELRTKLRELMAGCKDRGVGDVFMEVADCVGLTPILQQMSVFERLYADAKDRVRRLEKLREKVKRESAKLGNLIPESEPFLSVMDALEQDQVHEKDNSFLEVHALEGPRRSNTHTREQKASRPPAATPLAEPQQRSRRETGFALGRQPPVDVNAVRGEAKSNRQTGFPLGRQPSIDVNPIRGDAKSNRRTGFPLGRQPSIDANAAMGDAQSNRRDSQQSRMKTSTSLPVLPGAKQGEAIRHSASVVHLKVGDSGSRRW